MEECDDDVWACGVWAAVNTHFCNINFNNKRTHTAASYAALGNIWSDDRNVPVPAESLLTMRRTEIWLSDSQNSKTQDQDQDQDKVSLSFLFSVVHDAEKR